MKINEKMNGNEWKLEEQQNKIRIENGEWKTMKKKNKI